MHVDRRCLRIAILHSSAGLVRGGLETLAAEFVRGLAGRGHQVSLVSGAWSVVRPLAEIRHLPARLVWVPCLPATWLRLPGARRPGLPLHVQSLSFCRASRWHPGVRELIATSDVTLSFFDLETVAFSRWRQRCGKPHVSHFSGAICLDWLRDDVSVLRLATSETIATAYRQRANLRIDGVVTPGVSPPWFEAGYQVRTEARRMVFVGRLEANKGIVDLLRIVALLAPAMPGLSLRLVGDGPLRPWVEDEACRLGLAGRVSLAGSLPPAGVRRELRQADLFVFPSHYESFGIAVLEAMAVGLPVVCSDLPALAEVTGDAALRVPPGDDAGWVACLRQVLPDRQQRDRLSQAGRARAGCYTWARSIEALESNLLQAASPDGA